MEAPPYALKEFPFGDDLADRPRSTITGKLVPIPEERAAATRALLREIAGTVARVMGSGTGKESARFYLRKKGEEGIYQEPAKMTLGEILVDPRGAALPLAEVRGLMKAEMRARGPRIAEDWFDQVLRGNWWHGRRTYPRTGETFPLRVRPRNVGEPQGISLTANPELERFRQRVGAEDLYPDTAKRAAAVKNRAFRNEKGSAFPQSPMLPLEEKGRKKALRYIIQSISSKPVARVLPLFGGQPTGKVLRAWKGSPDEEILRRMYMQALDWTLEQGNRTAVLAPKSGLTVQDLVARALGPDASGSRIESSLSRAFPRGQVDVKKIFNRALDGAGEKLGYKGMLYARGRYGEDELKMFDPGNVLMLDLRNPQDPRIGRTLYGSASTRMSPFIKRMRGWGFGSPDTHEEAALGQIYKKMKPGRTWEDAWKKNMGGIELKLSRKTQRALAKGRGGKVALTEAEPAVSLPEQPKSSNPTSTNIGDLPPLHTVFTAHQLGKESGLDSEATTALQVLLTQPYEKVYTLLDSSEGLPGIPTAEDYVDLAASHSLEEVYKMLGLMK